MAKIYGTPIMAGGAGGMNKDLPPLLDNFKAFKDSGTSENPNITIQADKMATSRANELAGAVWVYGDHEPENVNDGTKIQLTREEVVTSDGGEAQTVTKTVEWNNEADFFARQFTYNSKKQYQTMLEGATANIIYSEFPAEPTEYLDCAEISETTEYEIPEDGWFRIDAIAKSGNGGYTVAKNRDSVVTPGGGGTGGYSRSEIAANKGDIISIEIQNGSITIKSDIIESLNISVSRGENGIAATTINDSSRGGSGGIANGGNKINEKGLTGSAGRKGIIQPEETYYGGAGATKSIEINSSKTHRIEGGRGRGIKRSRDGAYSYVSNTTGTEAVVFISRGNTNIPSPSKSSTLSLIPKNNSVEATWENSGDPVQTGTMLVYNTSHTPKSPSDGVAVDVPLAQPVTFALSSNSKELQEDSKKQSYTITGVPNDKPVFVALFPYDKDRKYGLAKQEVEIPREHSWYDKQQELEAEVETVKAEMSDYQSYYTTTQEVLK